MKILISGSTGLVGSAVRTFLEKNGNQVFCLVRKAGTGAREIFWDPEAGILDPSALGRIDAVIHLAGENISSGRWTAEKKRRIFESRVRGTRLIAQSLERLSNPPKVLISASAVGVYGDRGEEELTEDSGPGKGFLPDVCREWEKATNPAALNGVRVVIARLGMVLSPSGGALSLMLPIFRLGIGGRIGSGRQWMSWISISDLVGLINHALCCESLSGPVNAVSPFPVTNQFFSATLGRVLSRPVLFALPAFAARIIFGEMAEAALLASAKVLPARLTRSGYTFCDPDLEPALRNMMNHA